jgi:hypothetical protein
MPTADAHSPEGGGGGREVGRSLFAWIFVVPFFFRGPLLSAQHSAQLSASSLALARLSCARFCSRIRKPRPPLTRRPPAAACGKQSAISNRQSAPGTKHIKYRKPIKQGAPKKKKAKSVGRFPYGRAIFWAYFVARHFEIIWKAPAPQ